MRWFKEGRQGTGYKVLTLWKWLFDFHLIYVDAKVNIPEHVDKVEGKKHYRINFDIGCTGRTWVTPIGVREGYYVSMHRLYWFRPDIEPHLVKEGATSTLILSLGWAI